MILNALFFDYDLKKAIVDPRFHNQLSPNTTQVEPDFNKVGVAMYTGVILNINTIYMIEIMHNINCTFPLRCTM